MKILLSLFVGLIFFLGMTPFAFAQGFENSAVEARISQIESFTEGDAPQYVLKAVTQDGQEFLVDTAESFPEGFYLHLKENQKIILQIFTYQDGTTSAILSDVVRLPALIWIFVFFCIITIAVGFLRGLSALLGLIITIAILFLYVFPSILNGADPVITTIIGSIGILGINMHLSHGLHKKTFVAFLGTFVGLILVVIFAHVFVSIAKLSGLGSEEAMLLYVGVDTIRVPAGILLAGIILGAVGVLDDITIAQSEVVTELLEANPALSRKKLFLSSMRIGRHHIASTINTLVLAYVGAALPLFLVFIHSSVSMREFLNIELVAEEIIRTIAGTMALVLTVPISTAFSVFTQGKTRG